MRAGPPGKEGQDDGPRGKVWAGFCVLAGFPFSKSISYHSTQNYLNSNEFEFKLLYKQNKTMHQHECNPKIKPMINFNYL